MVGFQAIATQLGKTLPRGAVTVHRGTFANPPARVPKGGADTGTGTYLGIRLCQGVRNGQLEAGQRQGSCDALITVQRVQAGQARGRILMQQLDTIVPEALTYFVAIQRLGFLGACNQGDRSRHDDRRQTTLWIFLLPGGLILHCYVAGLKKNVVYTIRRGCGPAR